MHTPPSALKTYRARAAGIDASLHRLRQLADDHVGHDPDAIRWSHVGDLGRVDSGLNGLRHRETRAFITAPPSLP